MIYSFSGLARIEVLTYNAQATTLFEAIEQSLHFALRMAVSLLLSKLNSPSQNIASFLHLSLPGHYLSRLEERWDIDRIVRQFS